MESLSVAHNPDGISFSAGDLDNNYDFPCLLPSDSMSHPMQMNSVFSNIGEEYSQSNGRQDSMIGRCLALYSEESLGTNKDKEDRLL